jgi:branched-chain amino acid transport system ATP-binding protein
MSDVILEINNLTSGYGDLPVLHGVSLSVNKGEIYSILGANGAGKSTLLNTLAGTVKATSGAINFNGVDLAKIKPHKIAENGLVLVPEGRKLFPDCSVEDNLKLGAYHVAARKVAKETIEEMYEMFPRLAERKDQLAGSLSGGEQQMCAIARGLMAKPKILMLDEPSLGLAPIVVSQVFELIAGLPARGLTVLLVEQNVAEALSLSARASVLEQGNFTLTGTAKDLLNNPTLQEAYLGVA